MHPRFGTRNRILPLTDGTYLELVEVLDHPASDKAPFGQAVRARSELGGGWMGWVVAVDDITPLEQRLGRESVKGNRHRPDGTELLWRQLGVKGLQSDPQLPFFVQWETAPEQHPSTGASGNISLESPRDRRRPAPGSPTGSALRSSSRWRTSRSSGSPRTARPASSRSPSRPRTASSASD